MNNEVIVNYSVFKATAAIILAFASSETAMAFSKCEIETRLLKPEGESEFVIDDVGADAGITSIVSKNGKVTVTPEWSEAWPDDYKDPITGAHEHVKTRHTTRISGLLKDGSGKWYICSISFQYTTQPSAGMYTIEISSSASGQTAKSSNVYSSREMKGGVRVSQSLEGIDGKGASFVVNCK